MDKHQCEKCKKSVEDIEEKLCTGCKQKESSKHVTSDLQQVTLDLFKNYQILKKENKDLKSIIVRKNNELKRCKKVAEKTLDELLNIDKYFTEFPDKKWADYDTEFDFNIHVTKRDIEKIENEMELLEKYEKLKEENKELIRGKISKNK